MQDDLATQCLSLNRLSHPRRLALTVGSGLFLVFLLGQLGFLDEYGRSPGSVAAQTPTQVQTEICCIVDSATTTVVYPATTASFANPERGFYHHTETFAVAKPARSRSRPPFATRVLDSPGEQRSVGGGYRL